MPAVISFDTSGIDKFEKKTLQQVESFAFPLAVKNTLNSLAFQTRKKVQETIQEDFVNRNKFTERSVRVEMTKTLKMSEMVAKVGSVAPWMEIQEEGGKITSKGKYGLRIPTGAAAGQAQLFPRRKMISKTFRRGKLKLANKPGKIKALNRKQFILMSVRVAGLRGQSPFVFLPLGGNKTGVYKVISKGSAPSSRYKRGKTSFSRKFKWGRPKGKPGMEKLVFIHSFSERSTIIRSRRIFQKNAEKIAAPMAKTFIKEADRVFDKFVK